MKKSRYVLSLVLNILVIAAVGFAVSNYLMQYLAFTPTYKAQDLIFEFGVLSAGFVAIVALISVISNVVCLSSNKQTCKFVGVLKLISVTVAITAALNYWVVDLFVLPYFGWGSASDVSTLTNFMLDWHAPLFITIVAPALVVVDYFFFQLQPKMGLTNTFWALVPAGLYFGFFGINCVISEWTLPNHYFYDILKFSSMGWLKIVDIILSGVVGMMVITLFALAIRNAVRKVHVKDGIAPVAEEVTEEKSETSEDANGEEIVAPAAEEAVETKEETPAAVETTTVAPVAEEAVETKEETPTAVETTTVASNTTTTVAPAAKTSTAPKKTGKRVIIVKSPEDKIRSEGLGVRKDYDTDAKSAYKSVSRVYHISKQASGKWQVKLATGERAIKLFDTQLQAINYAKALVRTQGGSIRIHSVSGKMRKE